MVVDAQYFRDKLRDAGYSANNFAEVIAVHRSAISKMLNGQQEMTPFVVEQFCRFTHEPMGVALRKAGLWNSRDTIAGVRVVGWVEANGLVVKKREGLVDRPPNVSSDTVALRMPHFYDWTVYYSPFPRVATDAHGRLCVAQFRSGNSYVRVLERGRLRAFCGSDTIDGDVVTASPITFIKTL